MWIQYNNGTRQRPSPLNGLHGPGPTLFTLSQHDDITLVNWDVLHLKQMSNTFTVRLPQDLAKWLDQTARRAGVSRGRIVRMELERARKSSRQPFLRLAGAVEGPADLSTRKGFSRE